jgi:hypothetical protein
MAGFTVLRTLCRLLRHLGAGSVLASALVCTQEMAYGGEAVLGFAPSSGATLLADAAARPVLVVDASDYPGVRRAAGDLAGDLGLVTGCNARVDTTVPQGASTVVLAGTLGHSPLIDNLVSQGRLDVSGVAGRWEACVIQLVKDPAPGLASALVVAGSDKRGTIYGLYELSEQAGVSPWHWWADVPVRHHDALYALPGRSADAGPAVRYRGLFLNDEEPSLSGWAREKFGGYNSRFYSRLFELILRLRGNYLWPAMWNSAFNEDDPANPALADEYGIVMGTSHHEPMLRAQQEWARHGKGPWDFTRNEEVLKAFWAEGIRRNRNFESIVTVGMRGDGDLPMEEDANTALLQRIVAEQRSILARETGRPAEQVPQLWALYKEVQGYFERGMRVPDDVTLLWCDDNWGNIRRLPTPAERLRPGGAGVYYHFDYVGGPRSYKWLHTVPLPKVWEQMSLALESGADRIWIVNVGDLKPMELPSEYFLRLGWNAGRPGSDDPAAFVRAWAEREFGRAEAAEIADIVTTTYHYNGRRKPELLEPSTFSLVHYGEAQRVVADWKALEARAEAVAARLPAEASDAYYQLVLHSVKACRVVNEMFVTAGLNRLHAVQGRNDTNLLAARVRELFAEDAALTRRYNALGGGRWNHFMDQVHLGYRNWQQPPANAMPAVTELQLPEEPSMAVAIDGMEMSWNRDDSYVGAPVLPTACAPAAATQWIEVFNRGSGSVRFTTSASEPWLTISPESGEVSDTRRLHLSVDWGRVPEGSGTARITVRREGARQSVNISLPWRKPGLTASFPAGCFLDSGGYVAMEAAHCSRNIPAGGAAWAEIPGYGRTLSGMRVTPALSPSREPGASSPRLEYDFQLSAPASSPRLRLVAGPTLAFVPGRGLRCGVSVDGGEPVVVDLLADTGAKAWDEAVSNSVREVVLPLPALKPGAHVLRIHMVDPALVLERLLVDAGGLRPSYLGAPESQRSATP